MLTDQNYSQFAQILNMTYVKKIAAPTIRISTIVPLMILFFYI